MAKNPTLPVPPAVTASIGELQARCARAVSRVLLEAAGELSRSTALLALLDDYIPGLQEVWVVHPQADPISWRELAGIPAPALRRDSSDEPLPRYWFDVPGHTAALVLGRPEPLTRHEQRCAGEVAAAVGTILELRTALTQRARVLREDFDLLVESTREISRCDSLDDLYETIAREGQRLLKQKRHNLICLQRYSAFDEEISCVAFSGEEIEGLGGLRLTTSHEKLKTTYYPRYEDGRMASELPRQQTLSFTGAMIKERADYMLIADVDTLDAGEPYYCLSIRTRSELAVPITLADGTVWGVLNVENPHPNAFSEFFDLPMLQGFARIIAVFIHELERRDKAYTLDDIISLPADLKKVIRLSAQSSESVLITGETGTGKELVARALHYGGTRKKFRFIPINCGAIEPNLMMSELFGHTAYSYTGAGGKDKVGLFAAADRGSIFLDEIENMPISVQEALLRVVERGELRKVGATTVDEVDVRVIAATNIDLKQKIREGTFRQDLYYRLKILEITVPPLRERREFIPVLLETFVGQLRRPMQDVRIEPELVDALLRYHWPGNVRELKNLVKRMLVFSQDLTVELLPPEIRQALEAGEAGYGGRHPDAAVWSPGHPVAWSPAHPAAGLPGAGSHPALFSAGTGPHNALLPIGGIGPTAPGMPPGSTAAPDRPTEPGGPAMDLLLHFDREAGAVLEQVERRLLQEALTLFRGDRYQVAKFLGLSPPSVYRKIREYDIQEEKRYR